MPPRRKTRASFKSDSDSDFEFEQPGRSETGFNGFTKASRARSGVSDSSFVAAKTEEKKESAKSSYRLENLRERLEVFYGNDDKELVEAIKLRAQWGATNFSFLPSMLSTSSNNENLLNDSSIVCAKSLSSLQRIKYAQANGSKLKEFPCIVDGVLLDPHASRTNKVSTVLNAGLSVISMDFQATHPISTLALGVLFSHAPPMDVSTLTNLSEGPSLLHLYRIEESKVKLSATIWSDQGWGPVVCVKWRPGSNDIAACFGNGKIALLTVSSSEDLSTSAQSKENDVKESENTYKATLNPLPDLGKATKTFWRTTKDLIVGYESGYIAEFDVSDEDSTPSYFIKAHYSVISALCTGSPNYSNIIFSTSVDGFSAVHNVSDLRKVTKTPRSRLFSQCSAYSQLLGSFVTSEDGDSTKLVPLRLPGNPLNVANLTRHNGLVNCVCTSPSHPLVASGGQDGTIHLTNGLKRTMVTRRQKDVMQDVTLWQLECSHKTGEYRFMEMNEVNTLKHRKIPSTLPLFPPSVTVVSMAWHGSWLISATSSGLVRLDNIIS